MLNCETWEEGDDQVSSGCNHDVTTLAHGFSGICRLLAWPMTEPFQPRRLPTFRVRFTLKVRFPFATCPSGALQPQRDNLSELPPLDMTS
jgi:hypothetical protein